VKVQHGWYVVIVVVLYIWHAWYSILYLSLLYFDVFGKVFRG
jgi:hypothetical protein